MKPNQRDFKVPVWKWIMWLQWPIAVLCFFLTIEAFFAMFRPELLLEVLKAPVCLEKYLDGKAIAEILGTIGLLAIVAGPLLGITEQRVLGERIGTLVNWAYPVFFKFYFFLFIITTLLGIYAAIINKNETAIYLALLGVLLGTAFILLVCYVFLVPGVGREMLAFSYYENQLTLCEKRNFSFLSEREIISEVVSRDHLLHSRLLMLKLAGALARREAEGRELWTKNVRELWVRCVEQCEAAQQLLDPARPLEAGTDYCCLLAKKFWELLSKQAGMPLSQLEILPALLFSREPLQPSTGKKEKERERKELQVENYLAAGLLFTEAFQQPGADRTWHAPYQLLCDLYCGKNDWAGGRIAFKKLFWGLAWIMVVHSVYEDRVDFCFMQELYYRADIWQTTSDESEEELRSFLNLFHKFYLGKTRFHDGIKVGKAKAPQYESRLLEFLNPYLDDPTEIGWIDTTDDLAVVRKILLKEGMYQ